MKNAELIKTLKDEEFEKIATHQRIDECAEAIRLNHIGSTKDYPTPYKNGNNIWFATKADGFIPFFKAIQNQNGTFSFYEMTYTAYCQHGF